MKIITLPASPNPPTIHKLKDCLLKFETRALSTEELGYILDQVGTEGWLLYSPNPIKAEDIPTELADLGNKTLSQRLRSVLYVYWQKTNREEDFDTFYRNWMNGKIDQIKENIPE